jgi:hypothetical protein
MEKSRASFRWTLSCAMIGLVVSISPCFAADLGASQGMQRLGTAPPEIMPFRCDSLDPQVCFDIYLRLHNEPAGGLPFSNEGWLSGLTAGTGVELYRLGTPNIFGTVPSGK